MLKLPKRCVDGLGLRLIRLNVFGLARCLKADDCSYFAGEGCVYLVADLNRLIRFLAQIGENGVRSIAQDQKECY